MGKLADWSLFEPSNNNCSECGMDIHSSESKGCCDNEASFVKLEQDQKKAAENLFATYEPIINEVHFSYFIAEKVFFAEKLIPNSNAPPRTVSHPIFLFIGSIRI